MKRSLVREHLFKLLFRIEFNTPEDMPEQVRLFFEDGFADEEHTSTGSDIPEKDRVYMMIDGAAKGWSISRIGKVELAVLRLAVYEMLYDDDIPVSVAIDEAVQLSKTFGTDNSGSFVNGILASLAN